MTKWNEYDQYPTVLSSSLLVKKNTVCPILHGEHERLLLVIYGRKYLVSFVEGALLLSLGLNAYTIYRVGKTENDIETLYEGTAMVMTQLGMTQDE